MLKEVLEVLIQCSIVIEIFTELTASFLIVLTTTHAHLVCFESDVLLPVTWLGWSHFQSTAGRFTF